MRTSTLSFDGTFELATARAYPERAEYELKWHDKLADWMTTRIARPAVSLMRDPANELGSILAPAKTCAIEFSHASDKRLWEAAHGLRPRLARAGFTTELAGRAFSLIRECAHRHIGQRHFDVQLMGGWGLLQGRLVEMQTGEGKTITATLAAGTAALAGVPVHVITVNDYLAKRDGDWMRPGSH